MAIPKVFVSSTCYDLQEERAQLERFITNYGFTPVLSEYSGVYYDIDAHTHESCINEVAHCDMFVLIISGRYGGKIKEGNGESITQAEYNKARELGLPIFTFVKADVNSAQHYYKENVRAQDEEFAKKITYPAIEKQADAVSIFGFIDSVHRAITNNGIETYQSFTDIENHLKKQWAGLFFSFLQKRKEQDKVEEMTSILSKLAGSSSKLEALVGSLHDQEVGKEKTVEVVETANIHNHTTMFYKQLVRQCEGAAFLDEFKAPTLSLAEVRRISKGKPQNKLEAYLNKLPFVRYTIYEEDDQFLGFSDTVSVNIGFSNMANLRLHYEDGILKSNEEMRFSALVEALSTYLNTNDE
ncbi:DUF4062 domain-containing protein [Vibrio jasicida]|uniref:DUF4062 domain-containing protein n=1 Tax=Vibrio jasicida TaxID=766224 RepID=UPI00163E7C46|nr:DUF4062 domain-containing protein [Vibrio jasicida]